MASMPFANATSIRSMMTTITTPHRAVGAHAENLFDDDNGDEDPPVELQPKFTEQDEQRELATLTIQDLLKLQSDLTGIQTITNGMSGIGLGMAAGTSISGSGQSGDIGELNVYSGGAVSPDSTPPAPLSAQDYLRLAALEQHMATLPAESTAAYFRATAKCPDEVSNERKMILLQSEEGNVHLAAQRLALYWQCRLDTFGEDRCFEPMTLAGAMRDEVVNMAKSRVFQLLPNTDAAGRAIIYFRMSYRDWSRYSLRQEIMCLWYLLEVATKHKSLRSRGLVLLVDAKNATRKQYSSQTSPCVERALEGAFPIRTRSTHICNGGPFINYLVYPVFQRLRPKHKRLRTKLHRGSEEEVLRSLTEFNLPRNRVPSDMGGSVVLDINQFLIDRISLEASNSSLKLPSTDELSSPNAADTAGKRRKVSENDSEDQADRSASTSAMPSANVQQEAQPMGNMPSEAAASRGSKAGSKRKGRRNVVDPRMAVAVRAKQEDPDLPLYDALVSGGFAFSKGPRQTDNDTIDEDGVSLKQRKNNLCRRLRVEEQKREENKRTSKTDADDDDDDGNPTDTPNDASALERRDSFDEAIGDLPGLDGLDEDFDVPSAGEDLF